MGWNYLSMLGLKLNHVSKRGHWSFIMFNVWISQLTLMCELIHVSLTIFDKNSLVFFVLASITGKSLISGFCSFSRFRRKTDKNSLFSAFQQLYAVDKPVLVDHCSDIMVILCQAFPANHQLGGHGRLFSQSPLNFFLGTRYVIWLTTNH